MLTGLVGGKAASPEAAGDPTRKLMRSVAFLRHLRPSSIARRFVLEIERRASTISPAFRVKPRDEPLALSDAQPTAVFPPRVSGVSRRPRGWTAFFLGRTVELPPGIDWRAPGPGSEDQLWRMNLHYMEYLEVAPDEDFQTLVDDWIDANPAYGQGWWQDSWNSYALSLRVVVWMQQLASRRDRLPTAFLRRANASLALQLRFLERRLETDLGGNHLIKNIKALVWASAYFAGPQAQRWRDRGLALLTQELRRQFLFDGMHFERSPSYHAQVFADLLECRHALVGASAAILKTLDKTLTEMAQVIADLAHPDGNVAQFNDAGLTMAYAPAPCLAAFQAVTGQAAPKPRRVFALPASGYFGFRSADLYLAVDCGRIGPDDLPAHGHGDILSCELSVGGLRFIVDPGVFEYIAGEKRAASRSAMTHNTLCIEGADQADFYGAFRCGRRPDVRVRKYEANADGFLLEGDHNGFAQAPGRPTPVRRFTVTAREVLIEDWIEGASDRPAWTGLLLHPDVTITEEDDGLLLCREGQRLRLSSEMDFSIEAAVWWPDMGIEYQTKRLRFRVPQTPAPVAVRLVLV